MQVGPTVYFWHFNTAAFTLSAPPPLPGAGTTNEVVSPGGVGDPGSPIEKCGFNPVSRQPGIRDDKPNSQGLRQGGLGNIRPGNGGNGAFHSRTGGKHDGVDIAAPVGTQVVASMNGTIVNVVEGFGLANTARERSKQNGGYGNSITIQYDNGLYGYYAHLTSVYVIDGMRINQGSRIGSSGRTGNANNNQQPAGDDHLHYGRFDGALNTANGRPQSKKGWLDPVSSLNNSCGSVFVKR